MMGTDDIRTIDPSTEQELRGYAQTSEQELDATLDRASVGRDTWARTAVEDRAAAVGRVAELLRERRQEAAALITREMGKPLTESLGEIDKCAWVCEYYAEHGPEMLEPQLRIDEPDGPRAYVRHDPLGTVLAIMPWNLPFWQVLRFAAPNLVAGNTIVLKHADNVTGSAITIQAIMDAADLPEGAFQTVVLSNQRTETLIGDPRIQAVTLTGSVRAGRAVATAAGRHIKPVGLELGGSDPFIVLPDADLDLAATVGAKARLFVGGQSCIAAKRFIVHADVADDFQQRLTTAMESYTVGDPMQESTLIGPLARRDIRDQLHDQIMRTVQAGARVAIGGEAPEQPGFYYPPTLLTDVTPDMAAGMEELFGPAAAMLVGKDDDELVHLANASPYGLGSSIWTEDRERGQRLAPFIEAGNVFINGMVRSDPRMPFGGVKESGYGRELGDVGILEFVNVKSVWVE